MGMSEPLFTVERRFTIRGRMLMLVGITADQDSSVKVGDPLTIQRPDGSVIQVTCRGVEYPPSVLWIERPVVPRCGVGVDLGLDMPVGSTVTSGCRT
jgi:hypothetical protein